MRAGLLRNTITITAPGTAKDDYGQLTASSSTFVITTRAAIAAVSGKEVYAIGAGFEGQISHKIVIRNPGFEISGGMSVIFGSRSFLVQYVSDPDERRRELDMICLEQNV